jgi:hypothetical protein
MQLGEVARKRPDELVSLLGEIGALNSRNCECEALFLRILGGLWLIFIVRERKNAYGF